ncbi:spermidine/spermine N(1)-acetyltransferase [Kordia sp. SMS9]|uniref:GNAT family N-acetyltransferase n=1 Tax=Kordia sp. SMS9 TaxID=2282170 RepID=UPI000E0D97CE|nr:GNAT family N-acetyltransferase [Kordia sp. SMS9]AXG70501.1 spermidine/spermine N(1)-acetyltransferase [Kordia sp. SMS9]
MIRIEKAVIDDLERIAEIGRITFLETYLPNTPKEAVESFVATAFDLDTLRAEFNIESIHYFIIFSDETLAGYGKIELNAQNEMLETPQLTKLERFYVLKEFHGHKLGAQLFNHLVQFSKEQQQRGMWLYVLIANERALRFYTKNNFQIVGEYDFKISETRYNPNYVMYLVY